MYPSGNNYNNPYPNNLNQPPGFNVPQQPGYPSFPNQNSISYGGAPIGFNVGQPDYNQVYQQPIGSVVNTNYGGYNQTPSVSPYQQAPSEFSMSNNQGYHQIPPQEFQGQPGGYPCVYPSAAPQAVGSNWSQSQGNQHQTAPSQNSLMGCGQQGLRPSQNNSYFNVPDSSYAQNVYQQVNMDCIGSGGEIYKGTIKPFPNFNAEQDCNVLRKAMKGIGTDEKAIIECLGRRCIAQRLEIRKMFKTMFGKDLIDELKSELSGDFCRAVIESLFDQDYYDAYSLRKAMEGAGTRENVLTEILTSRSNQQIENIKSLYKKWYNRDLEKDIVSETSGFYKRVLVSCLQANKKELNNDEILRIRQHGPSSIVNINQAKQEAQELYSAGEKKLGTDEACFIKIFALRNKYQLRATFDEYQKIVGRDIFTSIEREMSGDLASALKAIAMQAVNSPLYFATRLHKSMKGAGTNDKTLIRILLTRSEIDLENIKIEFQKTYGKTLDHFLRNDTSGDYLKFLLRFVEGN